MAERLIRCGSPSDASASTDTAPSSTHTDAAPPGDWVALRCDDAVFVLSKATIVLYPDTLFFNIFCSERSFALNQMARDYSHPLRPYVFDRPAAYVRPLVDFMRTGELVLDRGVSHRGVRLEAEYFAMPQEVLDALADATPLFPPPGPSAAPPPPCCTRLDIEQTLRHAAGDAALRFRGMNFAGVDFSRLDLHHANFALCNLTGCNFSECDLTRACLARADCTGANFTRAQLCNADCREGIFTASVFEEAKCHDSNFVSSVMVGIKAGSCDFSRSSLERCNLSNAELRGTVLHGVNFRHVNLNGVERSGTNLTMGGVLA